MKVAGRKIRGIDAFKGLSVRAFRIALRFRGFIPGFVFRLLLLEAGLLLKAFWFLPFLPWRAAVRNLLRLSGSNASPRSVYFRLVDGTVFMGRAFLEVHRRGLEAVLPLIDMTERADASFRTVAAEGGRAIVVLPHVLGGIFSAALVTRRYKTLILSRGPRNPKRAEIQREFMKPLGLELLVLDRTSAVKAARQFLTALKEGHLIVGTTDLIYRRDDTIESTFFGQPVHLPSWPARFARQAKAPILPGFVRVGGDRVEIDLADPIRVEDLGAATRAWAEAFERFILSFPEDWAFLVDRRWGKLLAAAARAGWSSGA